MIFLPFSTKNSQLIAELSECYLQKWVYENQNLDIYIESENFNIQLQTTCEFLQAERLSEFRSKNICRLQIINIKDIFNTINGYYVPPIDFHTLMKYKKYSYIYGTKNDKNYIFELIGYRDLLSFTINNLNDIKYILK
ncbi:hypothetical protein [Bartonella sp. HY761]|uniref:hypothetical protein n=1 Tax=Bartonella sp. HY761 TaxID=2979330 RepID=UPI0021FC3A36|nr:hypothetical protein [Bartonella sp. HY761]UXN07011.1 hypothetical protein N6A79_03085 [Bartonella sp. HY761]